MTTFDVFLGVFLGFMAAGIVYDLLIEPALHLLKDLSYPFAARIHAWVMREPYISSDMFKEAYGKWLEDIKDSIETYGEFLDADGKIMLNICPKCVNFKRSFAKEGRNRICMDCEFGERK